MQQSYSELLELLRSVSENLSPPDGTSHALLIAENPDTGRTEVGIQLIYSGTGNTKWLVFPTKQEWKMSPKRLAEHITSLIRK